MQAQSHATHVHDGRAAERLGLIQCERLARAHTLHEVRHLRLRIREVGQLLLPVRQVAYEVLIHIAVRTSDVRRVRITEVAAPQHYLAPICIRIGDAAPRTHGIVVLLRSVYLHLHRAVIILAQDILHRVDIVLPHVAQTTGIIVPIAAERLMRAMYVVRLVRRRSQPHIVVQLCRYLLRLQILLAYPVEFPVEARMLRDGHLQRPTQQSALYQLLQRFHRRAQSVELIREAEPRVDAEHTSVLLHCLAHPLALAYGACHRLLTPDVLARLCSLYGHQCVPVWWCSYVYDVHVRVMYQVAVVVILRHTLGAQVASSLQVLLIHVTDSHQSCAAIVLMSASHATYADDTLRQLVARRQEAVAQHRARHDGKQCQASYRFQEISSADTHVRFYDLRLMIHVHWHKYTHFFIF